jgi:starch-binding outer membrane protein, SusD/RagB family
MNMMKKNIDNGITDMDLMRTSEMYLIKAEAAYYLHHTDEAKSVLYTLQQARMKEGKTAPEITATGEDLFLQRRRSVMPASYTYILWWRMPDP